MKKQNLVQLPDLIAAEKKKLLPLEQRLRTVNNEIEAISQEVDLAVTFDETLKNDGQRKAVRCQRLKETPHGTFLQEADRLKDEIRLLQIEIERMERQFSVAKLEKREAIAAAEAQAA